MSSVCVEKGVGENENRTGTEGVIIKGFLVASSLPSKAILNTSIPKSYKGEEIGKEVIRILRGYFYNKLGTLSKKFYNILKKHGVWAGFGYIIPEHKVRDFIREIDELRKEYEDYEQKLRDFLLYGKIPDDISSRAVLHPEYIDIVREYLREHGIQEIDVPDIVGRVKINLIPLRIDRSIIMEFIDEKVAEEVDREIERTKREIVEKVSKDIEEKINTLLEKLKRYEKRRITEKAMRRLKEDAEEIVKTAKEIGVHVDRIDALTKMIRTIEQVEKDPDVQSRIVAEKRLKALLKEFS